MTDTSPQRPADRPIYDLATERHDYPAWSGLPRRSILVCSHPRSGSTLLGEVLHFTGELGCPLEYFHVGFRPGFQQRWGVADFEAYAAAVRRWRTAPNGVLSVKLFWPDVEQMARESGLPVPDEGLGSPETVAAHHYQAIAGMLEALFPHMSLVHLRRHDKVRQAVSGLKASQSDVWRWIPGVDERPARQALQYDYERIERVMAYTDHCHRHWERLFLVIEQRTGVQPYRLRYEDLDARYEAESAALLRYLGCDAPVPAQRMQRQSSGASEALVLRFLRERQQRGALDGHARAA